MGTIPTVAHTTTIGPGIAKFQKMTLRFGMIAGLTCCAQIPHRHVSHDARV
jgi:hypothetical protein